MKRTALNFNSVCMLSSLDESGFLWGRGGEGRVVARTFCSSRNSIAFVCPCVFLTKRPSQTDPASEMENYTVSEAASHLRGMITGAARLGS